MLQVVYGHLNISSPVALSRNIPEGVQKLTTCNQAVPIGRKEGEGEGGGRYLNVFIRREHLNVKLKENHHIVTHDVLVC